MNIINPGPRCNNLWNAITTRDIALWLRVREYVARLIYTIYRSNHLATVYNYFNLPCNSGNSYKSHKSQGLPDSDLDNLFF